MKKTTLLEKAKELNIPRRNIMPREELEKTIKDTIIKYKEIIFGADSSMCMKCLDQLWRQQVIDQKTYDQKLLDDTIKRLVWDELLKNIAMDGDTLIDRRASDVLNPEVDNTC